MKTETKRQRVLLDADFNLRHFGLGIVTSRVLGMSFMLGPLLISVWGFRKRNHA